MKTYILKVELSQEDDGRWNANVPDLEGCYTWGDTREEALAYIQDAAKCCIEDMLAHGEPIPATVQASEDLVTTVTL